MTITDILGIEYQDFLEFCSNWGKTYSDELSASDFVAFRVQYGKSRDYVERIKIILKNGVSENGSVTDSNLGNNGDLDNTILTSFEERRSKQPVSIDTSFCSDQDENIQVEAADAAVVDGIDDNKFESENDEPTNNGTDIAEKTSEQEPPIWVNNTNLPLSFLLNVEICKPFYRISVDELPINLRMRRYFKSVGIFTIADVLNSSISKMFSDVNFSQNDIENTLRILKDFVKQEHYCIKYFMMQSAYPLSTVFDIVDTGDYEYIEIESVGFNFRFWKALCEHKIKSIQELLDLTISEMLSWKNLGRTSIEENINKLFEFIRNNDRKIITIKWSVATKEKRLAVARMVEFVKSDQEPDLSLLSAQEIEVYSQIKHAFDECGREFYDAVCDAPQYFNVLAQAFGHFAEEQFEIINKENAIDAIVLNMSNEILNASAKLMSRAYYMMHHNPISQFWESLPDDCLIKDLIGEIHSKLKTVSELSHIYKFLEWLNNLNLELVLDDIFLRDTLESGRNKVDDPIKDKYLYAIELRAAGETLESIGAKLGTTRERVRQIERRFTHVYAVRYKNSFYDTLAIIHALRGGDKVLKYDEVSELVGDRYTKLLWLLLSKGLLDNNTYRYFKKYNSVVFTSDINEEAEKMEAAFEAMPDFFLLDQYNSIIDSIVEQNALHRELFEMFIGDRFQLNGIVYSKHTPTVIFMVGYVLKERYINGYKIAVSEESSRFRDYLMEVFGEKGKKSARAIDAVVGQIGVLIDRGKYIHTDYVSVDQWIIDEINSYIQSNAKSVIPFSEVFDALKDVLAGTIITNRYILQGVLKKYGSPFTFARDYITKERGKSLTDEFEDFANGIGEFTKEDFFAAFPALTETNLAMLIGRSKNVFYIDNGMYMHSSLLQLDEVDYDEIRKYLQKACSENPINSRTLFDEFSYRFIDFIDRNDIGNHGKLFGILNYMFSDEFNFSRPYVAKMGTGQITNKAALIKYIGDVDSLSIEEAVDICVSNGIRSHSVWNIMHMLSPEYIRINKDKLLKFSLTGITDQVIKEVVRIINEELALKGYLSSALMNDFLFYPQINVSWNPYLVEAVVDLVGDQIGCINIAMSSYESCTHIFVSKKYAGMEYQQFILDLLDEAFFKGSFTNKCEMREWLYDLGLITTTGLPKFLEENKYYYMDGNGHLHRARA